MNVTLTKSTMTESTRCQVNRELRRSGYRELLPNEIDRAAYYSAFYSAAGVARLIASDR
jgi:hypothetical protein